MKLKLIATSIFFFIVAALLEIGGGWLVWQWLRDGRGWWLGLIGGVLLMLYGSVPTFQPAHLGQLGDRLLGRTHQIDGRVSSSAVVEDLDELEYLPPRRIPRRDVISMKRLAFQYAEEALHSHPTTALTFDFVAAVCHPSCLSRPSRPTRRLSQAERTRR